MLRYGALIIGLGSVMLGGIGCGARERDTLLCDVSDVGRQEGGLEASAPERRRGPHGEAAFTAAGLVIRARFPEFLPYGSVGFEPGDSLMVPDDKDSGSSTIIKLFANYKFTIEPAVLRIKTVEVETNLPEDLAVAAVSERTLEKSNEIDGAYVLPFPRLGKYAVEFELAVCGSLDDAGRYSSKASVRSRFVHFIDDADIRQWVYEVDPDSFTEASSPLFPEMLWFEGRSWLKPFTVYGAKGGEGYVWDPYGRLAREEGAWMTVDIDLPAGATGWLEPFVKSEDDPGASDTVTVVHMFYSHPAEQAEGSEPSEKPSPEE